MSEAPAPDICSFCGHSLTALKFGADASSPRALAEIIMRELAARAEEDRATARADRVA